jgi:hypothetical protein
VLAVGCAGEEEAPAQCVDDDNLSGGLLAAVFVGPGVCLGGADDDDGVASLELGELLGVGAPGLDSASGGFGIDPRVVLLGAAVDENHGGADRDAVLSLGGVIWHSDVTPATTLDAATPSDSKTSTSSSHASPFVPRITVRKPLDPSVTTSDESRSRPSISSVDVFKSSGTHATKVRRSVRPSGRAERHFKAR